MIVIPLRRAPRRFRLPVLLATIFALTPWFFAAPPPAKRTAFDIQAAPAVEAFKKFANQAGVQLLYAVDVVEGVSTNAVRGDFTPREALDRMTAGTALAVHGDDKNGGFSIRRVEDPNVGRAAPKFTRSDRPSEAAVELSPFVVNTTNDDGWLAGTTMLSTRTSQALKDVPVTIEVMTKEFMLDVGAYDAMGAAAWVANADVSPENSGVGVGAPSAATDPAPDSNRYAFRGVPNEGGPTRNLFQWLVPSDSYNVERIDFGRGSNSLLFGDVEAGGQGNIYTKRATIGRSFGQVLLQGGSFDSYRANLDYNFSPSNRFAARLNLTKSDAKRDFDFNHFAFEAGHLTMTYRVFKNTLVRLEGEAGYYSRTWGTNRETIQEQRAPGLGYTNAWLVVLPTKTIVHNTDFAALDRANPPTGATLSLLDNETGGFPRHYNWIGPDQTSDRHFTTASFYLEQKLGDLAIELSGNQQIATWDEIQMRGGYLVRTDVTGRRYIDFTLADRFQFNKQRIFRGIGTYNWKPLPWMSQLLVASAEVRAQRFETDLVQEKNGRATTGALNGNASRINYRVYVDQPGAYSPDLLSRQATLPETATFQRLLFKDSGRAEARQAHSQTLSASGRYFDGRLQSMFGVRRDANEALENTPYLNAHRSPRGERLEIASYDDHPEQFTPIDASADAKATTWNTGLVYRVNQNLNAYAIYSTSYRAANGNAVNFAGELEGQQRGDTFEMGVKSDWLNQKLVWTANWYKLKRSNVEFKYDETGITEAQLEDLFNPAGLSPLDAKYVTVTSATEKRKQFSSGYETTLIFYPGYGWNLRLSGAYKKVTQDESMPRFKELLAAAIARGNENAAYVAAAQAIVAQGGADGREIAARYAAPLTFNYAVNYRFDRQGRWRNFTVGLNGNYISDYVLNYINNEPVRGGKLFTVNGSLSYRTRLWNRAAVLRLNARNLIESDYITTGAVKLANGATRHINAYGEPRSWLLTTTVDF